MLGYLEVGGDLRCRWHASKRSHPRVLGSLHRASRWSRSIPGKRRVGSLSTGPRSCEGMISPACLPKNPSARQSILSC